jgi:cysteine desulfurase
VKINGSVYLDYQASSPIDPRVRDAMEPHWTGSFANPHSAQHSLGWAASKAVETAQQRVAQLLGADADEIVFTSGATEANNLALIGLAQRTEGGDRRRILTSSIEHKCVLEAGRVAAKSLGGDLELLPVGCDGLISLEALKEKLDDRVLVVSVMAVNNEIGTIQDLETLSEMIHGVGALFHCDAAQAPVAMNLDGIADLADLISLSGHKIYGPQGIGALYVRRGVQKLIAPIIHGGGQQRGLRSGTVPLALSVGMGVAAELLSGEEPRYERERIALLRDRFFTNLSEKIDGLVLNGPKVASRHPGNANIQFPGLDGEDLLLSIQPHLAASTGSACTSGIPEPSHVLRGIGLTSDEAAASVRFSFGRFIDEAMVDEAVKIIQGAITKSNTIAAADLL